MSHYELHKTIVVEGTVRAPFHCKACGFQSTASVHLRHTHKTADRIETRDAYALPILAQPSGPSVMSEPSPTMELEAKDLVAVAPCPRCGQRDPAGVRACIRRGWTMGAVAFFVLGGIGAGVGRLATSGVVGGAITGVGVLLGAGVASLLVMGARRTLTEAVTKVQFPDATAPQGAIGR